MKALAFHNTQFDIVDHHGKPWLRANQIGLALGYADGKAIQRIYTRHKDEFTDAMTGVVNLTTPGGEQETRIFSLRGAHLLAMFSRTEMAAEFRRWVLDVLDHQPVAPAPSLTHRRWLVHFDFEGKEHVSPVAQNAFIGSPEDLLKAMTAPNGLMVSPDVLFQFIEAASKQLRHRSAWRDEQLKKALKDKKS
ncbi:BRO-N domain-containing protein [Oceanimonas smirnovii]|uniref:BRO-N domain-containing protein n=1 Tax=Oceanimonas smirnovii TaxID=264574 RepID=UPI000A062F0A|nr:Bro-N domain-containing protein [Oceanimonas smirnovii]